MKKVFALSAALLLSVLIAACGGEEEEEVGAVTPRAEPVGITFWHAMSAANEETLKTLTDRFNRSQDEVEVKIVYQGSYEDNLNKLLASLGSGSVPALIQLPDNHTQIMIDSEKTTPVQQFIDREGYDLSDFEGQVIDYYTVGGQLYAMPFSVSNPILYYNKLAFEEVGLDPERPPATLEEVREYSERLLKRDSSGNVERSGIALEVKAWYLEQLLAKYGELYANNGNGREGRATEAVFDSPTGLAIFEWWNDMIRSDLAINVGRNPDGTQHFLAVASGRAAMTIGTSAALRSIVDILASGQIEGVEPGTGPMPGLAGGTGGTIVGGSALWIINERPEEEQEAAWKYVKFLVEPEQQAEWYRGTGYLAIRKSAYELEAAKEVEEQYPHFRVAVEQLFEAPSTLATQGPLIGPFVQVREAVATAAEEMVLGSKDPADALKEAAERATEVMQDYERRLGR